MGYTTYFSGVFSVTPPLNSSEISYINRFAASRRMKREKGAYYVQGSGFAGQGPDNDIIEHNTPPDGQPGLWCHWEASDDGTQIYWNGAEKFSSSCLWIEYLIDHFLKEGAKASKHLADSPAHAELFEDFTFDHVVNGTVRATGEEPYDLWKIVVEDNSVQPYDAIIIYEDQLADYVADFIRDAFALMDKEEK